jgi:hypothetical protein
MKLSARNQLRGNRRNLHAQEIKLPVAIGRGSDGHDAPARRPLGRSVLRLEPRDRHVRDVVGSRDLDQRLVVARSD